ncbi:MAG: hypothetical protein JST68_04780 [Bacteroidetes bacterium]|nr:hypothetical protein [Bacteroidota bacterium]
MTRKKKQERMRKVVNVNFLISEYDQLCQEYEQTDCRSLSEYVRNILMKGPIIVKTRNVSMDIFLETAVDIKNDLRDALEFIDEPEIKEKIENLLELMRKIYKTCTQE